MKDTYGDDWRWVWSCTSWSSGELLAFSGVAPRWRGRRGAVGSVMSRASRTKMRRYLQNCEARYNLMVTLTYPAEWPEMFHVKRHLRRWWALLGKGMPEPEVNPSAFWFLEFQERGAPHYHLFIAGWSFISHEVVAKCWNIATGGLASVSAGTRTEALKTGNGVGYAMKYARKAEQKVAPDGVSPGRWWGVMGHRAVEAPTKEVARVHMRAQDHEMGIDPEKSFGWRAEYQWMEASNTGGAWQDIKRRQQAVVVACDELGAALTVKEATTWAWVDAEAWRSLYGQKLEGIGLSDGVPSCQESGAGVHGSGCRKDSGGVD